MSYGFAARPAQGVADPRSYTAAAALADSRPQRRRKLAHNTYLEREAHSGEWCYGVRFHSTRIIEWRASGEIILNCGGWISSLITRDRCNPDNVSRWYEDPNRKPQGAPS